MWTTPSGSGGRGGSSSREGSTADPRAAYRGVRRERLQPPRFSEASPAAAATATPGSRPASANSWRTSSSTSISNSNTALGGVLSQRSHRSSADKKHSADQEIATEALLERIEVQARTRELGLGARRVLVGDMLDNLRLLEQEIEEDKWLYEDIPLLN
mmetsp:Transcript_16122/g.31152  ORF Transcript_16122/g.31152 Transcript_16122/m.31152 type:complete len:158 (+) Transcript_16122:58-531(+)